MTERTPLKNNLPLAAVLFVILVITSIGLGVVARRSPAIDTDFAAAALLFGLSVINLTLLFVVLFVLVRNLVRAFLEDAMVGFADEIIHKALWQALDKALVNIGGAEQ